MLVWVTGSGNPWERWVIGFKRPLLSLPIGHFISLWATLTQLMHYELNASQRKVSICNMMTSSNGNIFRVTGHLCGEFTGPQHWPVTRSFEVIFDLRLNIRLSKQSRGWWFETPSRPLWRHCNVGTFWYDLSATMPINFNLSWNGKRMVASTYMPYMAN